jgi:hypothetical protein
VELAAFRQKRPCLSALLNERKKNFDATEKTKNPHFLQFIGKRSLDCGPLLLDTSTRHYTAPGTCQFKHEKNQSAKQY